MNLSDIVRFYSRPEVKKQIISVSGHREIVPRYNDRVGARPDTLLFEQDITEFVKRGATSFHASMERWTNPLLLEQANTKKEMDKIRVGWDLILDIDCPIIDFSKICALLLCDALDFHGIKNYSIKFSGGTGFHIGVPFESFPEEINGTKTTLLFPDGARTIADYLSQMVKNQLADQILDFADIKKIGKITGKEFKELVKDGQFDPYSVLQIDTIAISSRHLFRLPYTFNEKKWLVSVPIKKEQIAGFNPEKDADYKNVKFELGFLDKHEPDEAKQLFVQAFDWQSRFNMQKELAALGEKFDIPSQAVPKTAFPPCMLKILEGLEDGRKRAVFILINFLRSTGWDYDNIKKELLEWNQKNSEPLKESYILTQLNWARRQGTSYLPPNCDNANYYKDIKVCLPDSTCKGIKNPVVYTLRKTRGAKRLGKPETKPKGTVKNG